MNPTPAGPDRVEPTERQLVGRLIMDYRQASKARICGGADENGDYPEEDHYLLSKTAHVRHKNERLIELIARTSIATSQIRMWDEERIAAFCAQAEANNANDPFRIQRTLAASGGTTRKRVGVNAVIVG